MKPSGARAKGSDFELRTARIFSEWWGTKFRRVPLSGGFDKSVVSGDIFAVADNGGVDTSFPFSIECKNEECWDFQQLFKGTGPILQDTGKKNVEPSWWRQAIEDASSLKKIPLLVFTKNHHPNFVMYPMSLHNLAILPCTLQIAPSTTWQSCEIYVRAVQPAARMMLLDEFLRIVRKRPIGN